MNKNNYLLLIALCCAWLCLPITTNGQVKIGEGTQPEKGAVLDLKKTTSEGYLGGMLLPHVNILNMGFIPATFTDADKMAGYNAANGVDTNTDLAGLIVYNTNPATAGVYMWDGDNWVQIVSTFDPDVIPDGGGTATLTGIACYDIAETDYTGDNCGALTFRTKQDFTTNYALSYTFSSTTAVADVSFAFTNNHATIPVVESITNANPTSLAAGTYIITVNFKQNLNTTTIGLSSVIASTATLYAIYTSDGITYKKGLTVKVQDCNCCGAMLNGGVWKDFMCHNLGANVSYNPMVGTDSIQGAKYKFGNATPVFSQYNDINLNHAGWSTTVWATMNPYQADLNPWNLDNDPCKKVENGGGPEWRLPKQTEWAEVLTKNGTLDYNSSGIWSTAMNDYGNFAPGLKIGASLFLPAAGHRHNDGQLRNRGRNGFYWSSTESSSNGYYLSFVSSSASTYNDNRTFGFSVRCVAE